MFTHPLQRNADDRAHRRRKRPHPNPEKAETKTGSEQGGAVVEALAEVTAGSAAAEVPRSPPAALPTTLRSLAAPRTCDNMTLGNPTFTVSGS